MSFQFNSYRPRKYDRSRFLDGKFLLSQEASDIQLELFEYARRLVANDLGDVAIGIAWRADLVPSGLGISNYQKMLIMRPGMAYRDGLAFEMQSGEDPRVSADLNQPVTLGSPSNDPGGKILDFSAKSSGYYKVIVQAIEEQITASEDSFLQGAAVPETTEEKRRLNYTLNALPTDSSGNINGLNPNTFTQTETLWNTGPSGQAAVTQFFEFNDAFQINVTANTIVPTTDTLGSACVVTLANDDGMGNFIFPPGSIVPNTFTNGLFIDPDGTVYYITAAQVVTSPNQVKFTLSKQLAVPATSAALQPNPNLTTFGLKYTLVTQDVVVANPTTGIPTGTRNYPVALVSWNGTDFSASPFGFAGNTNIEDLRKPGTSNKIDLIANKQLWELTGGGNIAWNSGLTTLSWSSPFVVKIPTDPSIEYAVNSSDTMTLFGSNFAENEVLYFVIPNIATGSTAVSLQKSARGTGDLATVDASDLYVLAYRINNKVYMIYDSMSLIGGETKQLGAGLSNQNLQLLGGTVTPITEATSDPQWTTRGAPQRTISSVSSNDILDGISSMDNEIDKFFGRLYIKAANPNSTRVIVNGSDKTMLTTDVRSETLSSLLLSFTGAQIDFQTGNIYDSTGSSVIGTFTTIIPAANNWQWFSINLNPGTVNANETINGVLTLYPGQGQANSANTAPRAPLPTVGIPMGEVAIFSSDGVNVSAIAQSQLVALDINPNIDRSKKVDLFDPLSTTLPTGTSATIDNVAVTNGMKVLFANLSSGNNRAYQVSGVGTALVWTPYPLFASPYDPADGDAVTILNGTGFNDNIATFNGTSFSVNNVVRHFTQADYFEQDALVTSTLFNNTSGNIFTVAVLGSENIHVDYSISRSGIKETGLLIVTTDGVNAFVSDGAAFSGATGITFFADVLGGQLRVRYTSNNAGADATMKYSIKRWSDEPGGPAGIPNYSSFDTYSGGYINSGFNMSQSVSPGFQMSAPFNVAGLTRVQLISWTYLVGLNSGTPVGDLEVIVNGQVIPRFISGITTDVNYTEIDPQTIQFSVDLTASNVSIEVVKRQGTIDASAQSFARVGNFYDAIVGSALQVANGGATYTSLQTAINNASAGDKILVLQGSHTENISITKNIYIEGKGHGSSITGTFDIGVGSDYSTIKNMRFDGNLSLEANGCFVEQSFQSTGHTISDTGSANHILLVQET